MADESKYIYVEGGPNLVDGQVAICEVDPLHPYIESANPNTSGEHQAYVVKGDPKVGKSWVGRTTRVQIALGRGYLKEVAPPKGTALPLSGPPTETSEGVATRRGRRTEVKKDDGTAESGDTGEAEGTEGSPPEE